jgi:hypothetical protein
MPDAGQAHIAHRQQRRRFSEVDPFEYEDGDSVILQFQIGEVQSDMLTSDPDFLTLSYTRTMMAFLLFNSEPTSELVDKLRSRHAPYLIKSCQSSVPRTCLDRSVRRHAPYAIEPQAQ